MSAITDLGNDPLFLELKAMASLIGTPVSWLGDSRNGEISIHGAAVGDGRYWWVYRRYADGSSDLRCTTRNCIPEMILDASIEGC